jgi:phage-related protein
MAIGFSDGIANRVPDRALGRRTLPRVMSFGDDESMQRAPTGINSIYEEYDVSFKHRSKIDIDDIATFLDGTKGATNFNFTIPDTTIVGNEKTIKAVCTQYQVIFEYDNYYSLEAIFRRVYVP